MSGPSGSKPEETYWVKQLQAPDDPTDSVRPLVAVAIPLLWAIGFVVVFVNGYGDCFESRAVCDAAYAAMRDRILGTAVIVLVLTALSLAAFISAGRVSLSVLLIASTAVGVLAVADLLVGRAGIPFVPRGLYFLTPALALLIVGSLLGLRRPRRSARS